MKSNLEPLLPDRKLDKNFSDYDGIPTRLETGDTERLSTPSKIKSDKFKENMAVGIPAILIS